MDVLTPKRLAAAAVAAFAAAAVLPSASTAHVTAAPTASDGAFVTSFFKRHLDSQHADAAGHLPAEQYGGLTEVGRLALKNVVPEKIADVGVSPDGNYAFLSAWGGATCKYNGIHVVDIKNMAAPREVSFIPSKEGTYAGEGVQSIALNTPAFKGDILVSNSEVCKDKAGFGGVNIHDVTRASSPTPLSVGVGDTTANGQGKKGANQNHSVFAWQDEQPGGNKAYLVSVDNEESKDVDIFDITNPKSPKLIAEYDLNTYAPKILQKDPSNLRETFLHDMVVKEIDGKDTMLLSYWDAGYVVMDVENPAKGVVLADSEFAATDPELEGTPTEGERPEGNAHQAEWSKNNNYIIGADEDFAPFNSKALNTTDGTELIAGSGSGTPPVPEGATLAGTTVFGGRACNGDTAVPKATGGDQIVVLERGVCTFTEKVTNATGKGYEAAIIMNRTGSDACNASLGMTVEGTLSAFGVIPRQQGLALFGKEGTYDDKACLAEAAGATLAPIDLGAQGDAVSFSSTFDGWGYVHLYSNTTDAAGKLNELDTYAVPQAHDPAFAKGFGDLSVHEVAFSQQRNELAYFAYYSAGVRVTEIVGDQLVEKAAYIPKGGANIWGVEVFQRGGKEYIAASDRDKGLYILQYGG